MTPAQGQHQPHPIASPDDFDLVQRAIARDGDAFRSIMQRYNQRLYRLARSILRNDAEAEDAVQEAYVRAFTHLDSFRGDSSLATSPSMKPLGGYERSVRPWTL
jgi:RNA polymerase sigma-70 factor, ECF subfamily